MKINDQRQVKFRTFDFVRWTSNSEMLTANVCLPTHSFVHKMIREMRIDIKLQQNDFLFTGTKL